MLFDVGFVQVYALSVWSGQPHKCTVSVCVCMCLGFGSDNCNIANTRVYTDVYVACCVTTTQDLAVCHSKAM